MEIQFKGANCLTIQTKKAKIVIDDNLADVGLGNVSAKADIAIYTSTDLFKNRDSGDAFVIDGPGEYEVSEVSVKGIPVRANIDADGKKATVYRLAIESTMICILGHANSDLTDEQLEQIGMIDILIIPVGGNGYTLDAIGAEKVIKKIEPKVIIPTHYEDKGVKYEVPQAPLEEFIKQIAVTPEKLDKLKIKNDLFSDNLVVYHLERS